MFGVVETNSEYNHWLLYMGRGADRTVKEIWENFRNLDALLDLIRRIQECRRSDVGLNRTWDAT